MSMKSEEKMQVILIVPKTLQIKLILFLNEIIQKLHIEK
jgi:hypothetical protein